MAFIQSLPVPAVAATAVTKSPTCNAKRPIMTASGGTSRRDVLRLFSLAAVAAAAVPAASFAAVKSTDDDFDLKELKKDVEELKYDEELLDVGPDPQEKNPTRVKKKAPEPEFRAEEKELVEVDEKAFDAMVEKEKEQDAKIKAKFNKTK